MKVRISFYESFPRRILIIYLSFTKATGGGSLNNIPSYSGRPSAVTWASSNGAGGTSYERAYIYKYDKMNRDTAAIYSQRATLGSGTFGITDGWDENQITYDVNGNIKTLHRNSATQGAANHANIDKLTYSYTNAADPNQLTSVADASGSTVGFMAGSGTYVYDTNGNLTNEPYKGISTIAYNVLNKTDKITFTVSANRYIDYTYDAGGNVIRKRQYDNVGGVATLQYTTDYIDGFVYLTAGAGSPVLQYAPMPEGRAVYSGGAFIATYSIKDNQGNVRVEFDNTGTGGTLHLRQENSYYAFGMVMAGSVIGTPSNDNKNLYNGGAEWQKDFGNLPDYYQTHYRNYDAALGRWIGVDPMAEGDASMTTYQYAGNNPLMFNDPLGNLRVNPTDYPDYYKHGGGSGSSWDPFANADASEQQVKDLKAVGDELDDYAQGRTRVYNAGSNTGLTLDGLGHFITSVSQGYSANLISRGNGSYTLKYSWDTNILGVANEDGGGAAGVKVEGGGVIGHMASVTIGGNANQGGDPHAAELAKYGTINSFSSGSFSLIVVGGGSFESGLVGTDKGYVQRYITIHNGAGLMISAAVNLGTIEGKGNYKPTFSDWAGSSETYSGGIFMISGTKTVGINYIAWSGGFGESYGFSQLGSVGSKLGGGMTNSWTILIGTPYIPTANLSQNYINTMQQGGH